MGLAIVLGITMTSFNTTDKAAMSCKFLNPLVDRVLTLFEHRTRRGEETGAPRGETSARSQIA